MNLPSLILASASPRRQQFFRSLGIPFVVETADIDETAATGEDPVALAHRLAVAKVRTVGGNLPYAGAVAPVERLIVGADTVVTVDGQILGKPSNPQEATFMLLRLRARSHHVHTALAMARFTGKRCQRMQTMVNTTTVTMRHYSDEEIRAYVATGDPLDKAGAYAIQRQDFHPVASLAGCPASVMGLPATDLRQLLAEFGFPAAISPPPSCLALTGFPCCLQDEIQPGDA